MKQIPLRVASEPNALSTMAVLRAALAAPPANGLTIGDIRVRLDLMAKVEKAVGSHLLLEDAEHALLRAAIDATRFAQVDPMLVVVTDDLTNAAEAGAAVSGRKK